MNKFHHPSPVKQLTIKSEFIMLSICKDIAHSNTAFLYMGILLFSMYANRYNRNLETHVKKFGRKT